STEANQGSAQKIKRVSPITHCYPAEGPAAEQVWNIFICQPQLKQGQVTVTVLERHSFTTQTFIPSGGPKDTVAYLVVVADNKRQDGQDVPDLSTLQAFKCKGHTAVTYAMNQWHAPMIALHD
ncbi:ureidoglycolate hydrolase, partial [Protomyces lactucae-debilis]